jgi:hypothetical protein
MAGGRQPDCGWPRHIIFFKSGRDQSVRTDQMSGIN